MSEPNEKEMTMAYECPCCGSLTISEPGQYEICTVCGWEDDPKQSRDETLCGGANEMCLLDARRLYFTDPAADDTDR